MSYSASKGARGFELYLSEFSNTLIPPEQNNEKKEKNHNVAEKNDTFLSFDGKERGRGKKEEEKDAEKEKEAEQAEE